MGGSFSEHPMHFIGEASPAHVYSLVQPSSLQKIVFVTSTKRLEFDVVDYVLKINLDPAAHCIYSFHAK